MQRFKINDRIKIVGKNIKGKVAFVGATHFADGTLYGIAMDDPIGRHDGIMNGVRYFKCKENQGIFVKVSQLENVGKGLERSKGSNESMTKNKSSNGSSQEKNIHSEKQNCKIQNARKSPENGSKMRDISPACPQRKFKPKEWLTTQDQTKNMTDSARKPSSAGNGSKVRAYTQSCHQRKFNPKEKLTGDQIKNFTERKNEPKLKDVNFSESKSKECMTLKEIQGRKENDILNNEISYKDGQLATLQSELSRLKSCIHWSRKFSNSNSFKDINLKRFFTQEIDVRIKNMEDTIKNPDAKQTQGRFKDYKTLKDQNRFLQLYVVDLEKQTEFLMETILRIRGIVSKQKKNRHSDQNGTHKNNLRKHVEKLLKENAFSSQTFMDDEAAVCSKKVSPCSFDRDLESLAESNENKDESETFEPDTGIASQKQGKSTLEGNISPKDKKEDGKRSTVSIPDSEEYYMTTTSSPVRNDTYETKINKKSQAKKRFEPYPLNLVYNKGKKPTIVSKNTLKYTPKGSEELSSKFATASKKLSRPKQYSKTAHLLSKGPRQYEILNLFGANKQSRKVPSKPKAPNSTTLARGWKSSIRTRALKKKSRCNPRMLHSGNDEL